MSVSNDYVALVKTRIDDWKQLKLPEHKFMSVNNSSWHMSIFPKFHSTTEEVHRQLESELLDDMCYSTTSVIWDLKKDEPVYVWHSFNKLKPSTNADRKKYVDEENRKTKIRLLEKAKAQALEKRNMLLTVANEQREAKYKEYVQDCFVLGMEPVTYIEFLSTELELMNEHSKNNTQK